MKSVLRILKLVLICLTFGVVYSSAEDGWWKIKLTSGVEYEGSVEYQNDEVLVFQTVQGKKYQIPVSDVSLLIPIEKIVVSENDRTREKRFGVLLNVGTGMAFRDSNSGWGIDGGLQFIAANVLKRRICIGGGVGVSVYHAGSMSIFVPLTATLTIPFLQTRNAPFAALEGGYGFAVKGADRGGFAGGVSVGWLHRFESQAAVMLSVGANVQQGTFAASDMIGGEVFEYKARRLVSKVGIKLAVLL